MDELKDYGANAYRALRSKLQDATQHTKTYAAQITPVQTGALAAGYEVVTHADGVGLVNPVPYYDDINQTARLSEAIGAAHMQHVKGALNDLS